MGSAKIPYLYITGTMYRGSTLLAFLLNSHPDILSIGQMGPTTRWGVEKYFCSCGVPLLQCPFFLELERQVNALGSSFTLTNWKTSFQLSDNKFLNIILARPLRLVFLEQIRDKLISLGPGYRQKTNIISQRIVHLATAALAVSGKKVFVDSETDSIRIKFLMGIQQLDLKVIHLVRDVRGVVASFMERQQRFDRHGTVASFMNPYRREYSAWATRRWLRVNMDSERARRYVAPNQWLRLTYDELCTDPQSTMDRIYDFVGVRRTQIPKDFYEGEHHITGNPMRRKGTNGAVTPDEAWKDRLTKHDLDLIARIGGAANRYFGHDWP